jgi:hypothetical protein
MADSSDQVLQRAITAIGQSDPIIKLLQQVRLGRMKPTEAGLRAITDSWLSAYQKVLETIEVDRQSLLRLNPEPRVAVLIEAGVLTADHQGATDLRAAYHAAIQRAKF